MKSPCTVRGWWGVVLGLCAWLLRALGYALLVCCGVGVSRFDPLWVVGAELGMGHFFIRASEAVERFKREGRPAARVSA